MGYQRTYSLVPIGDDATAPATTTVPSAQLDKIDANTAEIIERLRVEKRARKIGTWVTIAGALLAAIRLGIVTVPVFLRRRAAALGQLGEEALSPAHARPNPARRSRRRRRR